MWRRMAIAGLSAALVPVGCGFAGPERSPRPEARPAVHLASSQVTMTGNQGFDRWVAGFRPRALAQGIGAATFDRAFAGAATGRPLRA